MASLSFIGLRNLPSTKLISNRVQYGEFTCWPRDGEDNADDINDLTATSPTEAVIYNRKRKSQIRLQN